MGDIGKTDREHYKCVADPQHLPSNGKYHSPQSEYHICQADILLPRPQLCILLLNPSPDYCTPRPSPLTLTHYWLLLHPQCHVSTKQPSALSTGKLLLYRHFSFPDTSSALFPSESENPIFSAFGYFCGCFRTLTLHIVDFINGKFVQHIHLLNICKQLKCFYRIISYLFILF